MNIRPWNIRLWPRSLAARTALVLLAGLALVQQLLGHTSGMAVPKYVLDLEGGGKVPMWPALAQQIDRDWVHGVSFRGEAWQYVNEWES